MNDESATAPPDTPANASVLVVGLDSDIVHFQEMDLVNLADDGSIRWRRRNRDAEGVQLRGGSVRYECAFVSEDESRMSTQIREMLDPSSEQSYTAIMVLYGRHHDLANQIVRTMAKSRGERSSLALIRFYCCGEPPLHLSGGWESPMTCTVPRPGDGTYHQQFAAGSVAHIDDDLAYYIAHATELPGEVPGVAVGGLVVAQSGENRFFLAQRTSGAAKGTFGTIGGPFHRGSTFIESLRTHARLRLGLPSRVVDSFREGPVLACTNLIGNLDHSVDITFLVSVDEPFIAGKSKYAGASRWCSFEDMYDIYAASVDSPGNGMFATGGSETLFAPVRNAFEGYCLLLLAGAVGETLIPPTPLRGVDAAAQALMAAERGRRKRWLRLAAMVHERIVDTSPMLYEQARWE